jgi:hypothetical protein
MKVIQTHDYKNKKFILTRTVSDFSDYELEVLKKLYDNDGLSSYEDEYKAKYNAVINNLIKVGLIYEDYTVSLGTKYQMSNCIKDILQDKSE